MRREEREPTLTGRELVNGGSKFFLDVADEQAGGGGLEATEQHLPRPLGFLVGGGKEAAAHAPAERPDTTEARPHLSGRRSEIEEGGDTSPSRPERWASRTALRTVERPSSEHRGPRAPNHTKQGRVQLFFLIGILPHPNKEGSKYKTVIHSTRAAREAHSSSLDRRPRARLHAQGALSDRRHGGRSQAWHGGRRTERARSCRTTPPCRPVANGGRWFGVRRLGADGRACVAT